MPTPKLDRKITIQTRDTARTPAGAQVDTWSNWITVYAAKKDIPSIRRGEMFIADQHLDSLFTEWTIRWVGGFTGSERLLADDGAYYKVTGIPVEVGRRQYLTIISERGVVKS